MSSNRRLLGLALGLGLVGGCSSKAPQPTSSAPSTGGAAPVAPVATVVYNVADSTGSRVFAAPEDGSQKAAAITPSGVDAVFAAALPNRMVLTAERISASTETGARVARLTLVSSDGKVRQVFGELPAGAAYDAVGKVIATDGSVVAELVGYGSGGRRDLFAFRAGQAPVRLAERASLIEVASGRAAFLAGSDPTSPFGDLESILLDGRGLLRLGAGDGQDEVEDVSAGRLLFTVHAGGASDVRLSSMDGAQSVGVGRPETNERAFRIVGDRIIFSRGSSLHSVSISGQDERLLSEAARPLAVAGDRVIFVSDSGRLASIGRMGGEIVTLDDKAGVNARVGKIVADRVVYTAEGANGLSLRSASLDGSGRAMLFERELFVPFVMAVTTDGRAIFHTSLIGQLEGGRVYSVKLDGSALERLGSDVTSSDGRAALGSPADQDFEALTPSGRVILEAEYEGDSFGSQLVTSGAASSAAQALTQLGGVRFASLVY